jgi:ATP-dependent RNA helicase SUPV3L1/SUV3
VAEEVKGLDQDVRAKMRKLGIKFGAYHIYVPASLKPAPRELAIILYALKNGGVRQPGVAELPQIVLSGRTSFLVDPEVNPRLYEVAGFKVAGKRAVRVDILERLADIIRPLIALDPQRHQGEPPPGAAEGNGFRVTVEMTSLLGTAGEDFASILTSLGYRVRRTPKPAVPAETAEATPVEPVAAEAAPAEAVEAIPADPTAAPAEAAQTEPTTVSEETAEADAVAAASEDAAEAIVNEEAVAAVEGTGAEPVEASAPVAEEAAAIDTATADLGASAPPESPPAEPEFDEVWFPGGRRGDNARNDSRRFAGRRQRPDGAAADVPADAAPDADKRKPRHHRRPNGGDRGPRPEGEAGPRPRQDSRRQGNGKPAEKAAAGQSFDRAKDHQPRERRQPAYDPDSPFAALAALRNPKPE